MDSERNSFPTTRWTEVCDAGHPEAGRNAAAMATLLQRYMPALRTYLLLKKRLSTHEADDVLQAFLTEKFLERNLPAYADPARGRFRTLVLTVLDRFIASRFRQHHGNFRGPSTLPHASHTLHEELGREKSPSVAFDVAWARQILSAALDAMKVECETAKRADIWGVFESRVVLPVLEGMAPENYEALVLRFSFPSPNVAANVLVTAKRMFVRHLRAIVAEYATSAESIDEEIVELKKTLAGAGTA